MRLLNVFRTVSAVQVLILLTQSGFAGRMIGGDAQAASLHESTAKILVILALFQFLLAIALRVRVQSPLWITITGGMLLGAEVLEFAAGHLHNVALHVPLGVAIFGGALRQLFWAVREVATTAENRRDGGVTNTRVPSA